MAWVYLAIAGLLEIGWAVGMRYSNGFTRLWPTLATLVALALSFGMLLLAVRSLPLGTAYAVWTGIGAAGTAVLGMYLFHEPHSAWRVACIAMIVLGCVGLRVSEH